MSAAKVEEQIIRKRLTVDERPLRRCIRQFTTLCETPHSSGTVARTKEIADKVVQEIQQFRHSVKVTLQKQKRTIDEIGFYTDECELLAKRIQEGKAEIKNLTDSLEDSRRNKRNKIEYDEIAKQVDRLQNRSEIQADIDRLNKEIEQAKQEEDNHSDVMESLKAQFFSVVAEISTLEDMSKAALNQQDLSIYLGGTDVNGADGVPTISHANSADPTVGSTDSPLFEKHDSDIHNSSSALLSPSTPRPNTSDSTNQPLVSSATIADDFSDNLPSSQIRSLSLDDDDDGNNTDNDEERGNDTNIDLSDNDTREEGEECVSPESDVLNVKSTVDIADDEESGEEGEYEDEDEEGELCADE